ncbi:adenylyltransferase/cytidyltransferase family protein [Puniceicoccus vermicola]|uniref:Adenylyltransferase/cytidyltransferase family protein n=1 Tax=Puniceicoccus vermicola TaxID=388746 RepID=A0A7X1E4S5_9BACT|nr:adenylyltransferase/cytidyltransferase family protein [Puniceicoccus vermicola]MBC2602374.1 adenylyltransferase/cytidyltransferase family protein [Puniceicoccus vermicola]
MRAEGKALVLTNGCFDLLHPGHISYLAEAAELGDELWIGINGDESVRSLKGPSRPVLGERERTYALKSLRSVSEVFVFPNPRLTDEIRLLRPEVYAKAGDYTLESLNPEEREALEENGTSIHFLPFLEGFSTTELIRKIKEAF